MPTAHAQGVPGIDNNKCLAGKSNCTSQTLSGLLKCRTLCQKKSSKCGVAQAECEARVLTKFDGGDLPEKGCFAKLEAKETPTKPASVCTTSGDAEAMKVEVYAIASDVLATLEGAAEPSCGDDSINVVGEHCDGDDLGDYTCASLGYVEGSLACDSSCAFDASACVDYDCSTIEVRRIATGEIQTLDFEEYLKGVLPRVVETGSHPEAVKAQAIAARSFALHWVLGGRGPICDTASCQVYGDTRYEFTDSAVEETRGIVAFYDGRVIQAPLHASSGGRTSSAEEAWGTSVGYLVAVPDLENAACTDDCDAWYPVDAEPCDDAAADCCYGRLGHGVGMSQRGAMAMADCGYLYEAILKHYYTGIELSRSCGN